jgi:hypothetical protein
VAQEAPKKAVSARIWQTRNASTRAIRRDVPLTNAIRKAFKAGTRDFTGRPGPNYWQLQAGSAIVTWPVDVWFTGKRTFDAKLKFGARRTEKITLDPGGRFPDRNKQDNTWRR